MSPHLRRIVLASIWPYPHTGGVSTHMELLERGLRRSGYDVRVVSATQFRLYHQPREGAGAAGSLLGLMRSARRYLRSYPRPDLVSAHDVVSLIGAVRAGCTPAVLTLHGYLAFEYASVGAVAEQSEEYQALLEMERQAVTLADAVIAVDARLAAHARSLGARTVHQLSNAVELDEFEPRAPLPTDPPHIILCPRRLTAKNGVAVAVRAARIVKEFTPPESVRWVIAGGGEQEVHLKELAQQLGVESDVAFLGAVPRSHLLDWYRKTQIVVIPSVPVEGVEEATSLAALEGMAAGRPVVASRLGGLAELIRDGIDGVLVQPGDEKALAEAVLELIRDPLKARRIGDQAHVRVGEAFGVEAWLERYQSVFSQVREAAGGHRGIPVPSGAAESREQRHHWLPGPTISLDARVQDAGAGPAVSKRDGGRLPERSPLRCAFLAVHNRLTGGALIFFEHANRLKRRGHQVVVFAPCPRPGWRRVEVPWVYVPGLPTVDQLARYVPPCDVGVGMFWTAVPALLRIPARSRVLVEQGDPSLYESERFPRRVIDTMDECYRAPVHLVTVSRCLSEVLAERYGRASIRVPNAVDLDVFRPQPAKGEGAILRVLVVGDDRQQFKGLAEVFQSLQLVRDRVPPFEVWHVTPSGTTCHEFPRRLFVRPPREELAKLYASADVYVAASWYESFGLTVLEAMACGTAVVTTDSGGVKEYAMDGHNCLVVPPRDPVALARAIERVLCDAALRENLAVNGLKTAHQYTWDRASTMLEQALYMTLDGPEVAESVGDLAEFPLSAQGETTDMLRRLADIHVARGDLVAAGDALAAAVVFAIGGLA